MTTPTTVTFTYTGNTYRVERAGDTYLLHSATTDWTGTPVRVPVATLPALEANGDVTLGYEVQP